MNIKAIDFFVYDVRDMPRAIEFYRNVLGLELEEEIGQNNWAEFSIGQATLALSGPVSAEWGVPHVVGSTREFKGEGAIAFAVDDIDAALAEMCDKGVDIAVEKKDSTVCYFAVIKDPDGNRIWLHQHYGD